jgi:hypothetical protein
MGQENKRNKMHSFVVVNVVFVVCACVGGGGVLPTKNAKAQTEHESIPKVETGLEESGHFGLDMVVVDGIEVHIKRR